MSVAPSPPRAAAPPAAVLWDMDGTIVDTEPYWIATEYELVAEFGGEWTEDNAHSIVGMDLRDAAAVLRDRGNVDLPIDDIVNRLLDGVVARLRLAVPWRPGARELLASLRTAGVPCALVTMSWQRFADAVVQALPAGSFDAVITGDAVTKGKPHPEPYLAAAAALGVRAEDCVAIEDSPTGVRSAVAAGCRTYAVPNVVDVPPGRGYTRLESLVQLDLAALGTRQPRHRRPLRWKPLAALGVVAALGTAGAFVVRRSDQPLPLPDIPISGWAPYWVLPEATSSVSTYGYLFQELSPFWFTASDATTVAPSDHTDAGQAAAFLSAARASGAKVIPTINDGGMKAGQMAAILADPASRSRHVRTIRDVVAFGGFDGIDIDYETFAFKDGKASWVTTRPAWVAFVTELAAALHADGKLLIVSAPPIYDTGRTNDSGYWIYDYASMGKVVDRIRIMAYDYSVAGGAAGPLAPLPWVRSVVRAAKRAVGDATKLVLGVPLYARNWVTATTGTCPATAEGTVSLPLRNVQDLLSRRAGTPVHDARLGESSFTYDLQVSAGGASCTQSREVHYLDAADARAHLDLARQERIGGVAFWAVGFDTSDVWRAVTAVARPRRTDSSVTTTSAP